MDFLALIFIFKTTALKLPQKNKCEISEENAGLVPATATQSPPDLGQMWHFCKGPSQAGM
jgi:hypothetical protein